MWFKSIPELDKSLEYEATVIYSYHAICYVEWEHQYFYAVPLLSFHLERHYDPFFKVNSTKGSETQFLIGLAINTALRRNWYHFLLAAYDASIHNCKAVEKPFSDPTLLTTRCSLALKTCLYRIIRRVPALLKWCKVIYDRWYQHKCRYFWCWVKLEFSRNINGEGEGLYLTLKVKWDKTAGLVVYSKLAAIQVGGMTGFRFFIL